MSEPSEPEKYSVDEIMARLKSRQVENELEQGELVTRTDGSQMIRVRKRKRRTQQPHKERLEHSRRARMIQVSAVLILLLVIGGVVGTAIIFANSAPFRQRVINHITRSCGANVELEQFRMNPTSANAGKLALSWPAGNALDSLTLRGVRADISPASFVGRSLTGEEVTAAEGLLVLRAPQPDAPVWQAAIADPPPVRFNHFVIPKAEVLLGEPTAPLIRLNNTELSLHTMTGDSRTQLIASQGDLSIRNWPKLQLARSFVEFRDSNVDVVVLRLRPDGDTQGVFELSGTVSPYASNQPTEFEVRLESFPLAGIIGKEFGRLLDGRIDSVAEKGSNQLKFRVAAQPAAALDVEFHHSLAAVFELNGLPCLLGLAQILDDSWFQRPVFESNVSGHIQRTDGKVQLTQLRLEAKGRMALRGNLTLEADRKLAGQLELGLTQAMIKSGQSRVLDTMFGTPEDGFRWLKVAIGGTATAPTDTFRSSFEAASNKPPAPAPDRPPSFEELTQPR